jgi:hypothetical protein
MGWMKNKGVAVALLVVAVAILGFVYKTQFMPESIAFDLKAKDGTVFEKVLLPANTQFPIEYQGKKDCQVAKRYWDNKAQKMVFLTGTDAIEAHMVPGDQAPKKK